MREFINIVESAEALGYTIPAYHGTGEEFSAFRFDQQGAGSSGSREGPLGAWFTDSEATARRFSTWSARTVNKPRVMSVKLRMRNPWVVDSYDDIRDLVDRHTVFARPNYVVGGRQIRMVQDRVDYAAARKELTDQGYDGILLPSTMVDSEDGQPIAQYVVFDAKNIRNADAAFSDGDSEDLSA